MHELSRTQRAVSGGARVTRSSMPPSLAWRARSAGTTAGVYKPGAKAGAHQAAQESLKHSGGAKWAG
eukprot:6694965-Lingulodinium_polyedra.AAC.1